MDMQIAKELWEQVPEIPECDHTALVRLMERMSAESFAELRLLYLDVLRAQMDQGRELGGLFRVMEKL